MGKKLSKCFVQALSKSCFLMLEKVPAQAIAHSLKVRKKIHAPENCPIPFPLNKIMIHL